MRRLGIAALAMHAVLSFPASAKAPDAATVCATVADCLSRARQLAHKGDGISPELDRVADRLHDLHRTATEPLLALLDDADEGMRKFAGYALRKMPGLGPHHLPRLARAMEKDPGWLPLAVARVGTPEAVHVLVAALRRVRDGQRDQIRFALEAIGPRAFPDLLLLFNCGETCDESLLRSVGTILAQQRERTGDAVDPLVAVADDSSAPLLSRRCAIDALGGLRATADPAVGALVAIARRGPAELGSPARQALLRIGGPGATAALVSVLDSAEPARYRTAPGFERRLVLRDIAELGRRGAGAGPTIEKYLLDTDPDVRVAAARTLGFIGRPESIPALLKALESEDDVQLAYVVVESLGRLGAADAIPTLDRTAREHWYPPVRAAAAVASRAAAGQHSYEAKYHRDNFALEYFDFEHIGFKAPCATRAHDSAAEPAEGLLDGAMANTLAYDREVLSYDDRGEHTTRRRVSPRLGIRLASGWLVGADHGEFGGELVFKRDDGASAIVLQQNVHGIHHMPDGRVVVVTGLSHLLSNAGDLYLVACEEERCQATRWKRVSADGALRMADCHQR